MRMLLLPLFLLVSTPAAAGPMDSRFGNTIIVIDAGGDETHLYYAADGTLTGKQGDKKFQGTWKIENGTLCANFTPELSAPNPQCAAVVEHQVGDTWTSGEATAKLVAGIQ